MFFHRKPAGTRDTTGAFGAFGTVHNAVPDEESRCPGATGCCRLGADVRMCKKKMMTKLPMCKFSFFICFTTKSMML